MAQNVISFSVIRAPGPEWAPGGAEGLRDPCPSSQTSVPRQRSGLIHSETLSKWIYSYTYIYMSLTMVNDG